MKKLINYKEIIRIREKELSDGSKSLYLDLYRNGHREYEFLKLYLIPEKKNDKEARKYNKAVWEIANSIKAQRTIELITSEAGLNVARKSKILLSDWLEQYAENKKKKGISKSIYFSIKRVICLLKKYDSSGIYIREVNKSYILDFISFMKTLRSVKNNGLKNSTIRCYLNTLNAAFNMAVREDVISYNPIKKLDPEERVKTHQSERCFLAKEELKLLENTPFPCKSDNIKKLFLFSCFCGLRYSDIKNLKWKNITYFDNGGVISIIVQKTKRPLIIPIQEIAMKYIPSKGNSNDNDNVFVVPDNGYINKMIKKWALNAGINKNVSFHTARHSFATLLLSDASVPLEIVKEFLGHSRIETTEIYAKITDKKKMEAMEKLNKIYNNMR
ncbi:MAG: site-specific integrase [Bacteroidales bacterium]|nr:site-specific integrase [Bacteroidales bacterium]